MRVSRKVVRWALASVMTLALFVPLLAIAAEIPQEAAKYRRDLTRNARLVWGIDAPVATFAAQIHQESGWRHDAKSRFAGGLAQFTPDTADWIGGVFPELADRQPFNPAWALRALVRYDLWLWERTKNAASACERWGFVLQSYNSGLGWVQKRRRASPPGDRCFDASCNVNPGVSAANQHEAENYPRLILKVHEPKYVRAGWGGGACARGEFVTEARA